LIQLDLREVLLVFLKVSSEREKRYIQILNRVNVSKADCQKADTFRTAITAIMVCEIESSLSIITSGEGTSLQGQRFGLAKEPKKT